LGNSRMRRGMKKERNQQRMGRREIRGGLTKWEGLQKQGPAAVQNREKTPPARGEHREKEKTSSSANRTPRNSHQGAAWREMGELESRKTGVRTNHRKKNSGAPWQDKSNKLKKKEQHLSEKQVGNRK